jgi:mono/diheme cytochrome c family protein
MKTSRFVAVLFIVSVAGAGFAALAADTPTLWTEHCAKCHGPDGKGQTKMGKKLGLRDLSDAAVQAKFTDEQIFKAMKSGLTDDQGKTVMKAVEGLTDGEMKALVVYVRGLKK